MADESHLLTHEVPSAFEGMTKAEIRQWFSPSLSRIEQVIGFDLTLKLVAETGGRVVYFTTDPTPTSRVLKAVGEEATEKLGKEFAGMKFMVPPGPYSGPGARRRRGIDLLKKGASTNSVALELRCARSTVQAWRKKL